MRISRLLIELKISVTSGTAGLSIAPSLHLQPLRDRNSSRVLSIFASFRSRSLYYQSLGYDIEGLVDETIAEVQQLFNQTEAGPCDMFAFTDLTPFSILDVCDASPDVGSYVANGSSMHVLVCYIILLKGSSLPGYFNSCSIAERPPLP